jgi:hypothetical protein
MTVVWVCVFHFFQCSVSESPKWSLEWCSLKQGSPHNPTLHFIHLNFVILSLFFVGHVTPHSFSFRAPVFTLSYGKSGQYTVGVVPMGLCEVEVPLPPLVVDPWAMQMWNFYEIILNHKRLQRWNCSEWKGPGGGKITSYTIPGQFTNGVTVCHAVTFIHLPHIMCYSVVHGYFQRIYILTEITLCWRMMHIQ